MDFLDLLFPKTCAYCGKWGNYLCDACKKHIRFFDFSVCPVCDRPTTNFRTHEVCRSPYCLDGLISIAAYTEPVSSLIKSIKYGKVRDASKETYTLFSQHWPAGNIQLDCLVPIPLHPNKLQERGFNQAELFAKNISDTIQVPVNTNSLIKVRETAPQASLKKNQRKDNENIKQCFVCLYKTQVMGKNVGLVDDVATTRTTLSSACTVLKKAGAKAVWGITLAHAF